MTSLLQSGPESEQAGERDRAAKRAYLFHGLQSGVMGMTLAMSLNVRDSSPDVAGAGMFLLVMWIGLPALCLLGAALFYSYRARADWRLVLLCVFMIIALALWVVEAPSFQFAPALEAVYIILTISFGLWWLAEHRKAA